MRTSSQLPSSSYHDNMCFHRSFENLIARLAWTEESDVFCDGSRLHGCKGCFCRRPIILTYRDPCQNCGAYLYDLLDQLWDIRQELYKAHSLKDVHWRDLFIMEHDVEDQMFDATQDLNLPSNMPRSLLLEAHTTLATSIVKKCIEVAERCLVPSPPPSPPVYTPYFFYKDNDDSNPEPESGAGACVL